MSPTGRHNEGILRQKQEALTSDFLSESNRRSTNLQVSADPPEDIVDAVSGQQRHEDVLQTSTQRGYSVNRKQFKSSSEVSQPDWFCGTFCPVSMVMARPFGTRPAVLCFFTSRTDTTGIQTFTKKTLLV